MKKLFIIFTLFFSLTSNSLEGWSINVGINNPGGANLGAFNFLKIWSNWAFEWGGGSGKVNGSLYSGVGASLKYVFSGKSFRPYLHAGFGPGPTIVTGAGASNFQVSMSTTGFAGIGCFWEIKSTYLYFGVNSGTSTYGFGGIGYDF